LPYTRWLDYCKIAFLTPEHVITSQQRLPAIIRRLESVTLAEAESKFAALRVVRSAFVFRQGSTPSAPSATDYILAEACSLARRMRTSVREAARQALHAHPLAGGAHEHCMLR
jgi:hypothetical protein